MYQSPRPYTEFAGAIKVAEAFRKNVRKSNEQQIKKLEEIGIEIPNYITNVEVLNIENDRADVYGKENIGFFKPFICYHLVYDLKNRKIVEEDSFQEKLHGGILEFLEGLFLTSLVLGAPIGLPLMIDSMLPSSRARYRKSWQWSKKSHKLKEKLVRDRK